VELTYTIPTLGFVESLAVRLFPFRWLLLGITLGGVAVLGIAPLALESRRAVLLAFRWLLPLVTWSWGLLLIASWFHPQRGTLRYGSPWLFGSRGWPAGIVRGYAALFLATWFLIPIAIIALWRVAV